MGDGDAGAIGRAWRRLTADSQELEDEQLTRQTEITGAKPICNCTDHSVVTVYGTLRSLTLRPRAGSPSLEAELYDGSGTVTLIWLGRRAVAGITPGKQLRATGRISIHEGRRTLYNPRYELVD